VVWCGLSSGVCVVGVYDGRSCIDHAAGGHAKCAALLVLAGCETACITDRGKTGWDLAEETRQQETIDVLQKLSQMTTMTADSDAAAAAEGSGSGGGGSSSNSKKSSKSSKRSKEKDGGGGEAPMHRQLAMEAKVRQARDAVGGGDLGGLTLASVVPPTEQQ
jgi:hypothetical protein